ncbi:two-component response regulator,Tn1549-like,CTn4-Orf26 [Clostridioides difficile]|nr:two-component response regulator [Clostridioides difficile]SJN79266.1 Sensory transduction protein regX3 [Clostridioides difficile]SJP13170.1 Sensory transduction protein regX3 [Clostridioides difficile]SJS77226.1 Sensory transduction protein regX3 [Clostridioides difficile]VFD04671.1 two-component response regulator,Tn1549-like,CTn4-Orf26 [Clostridioides difficile]
MEYMSCPEAAKKWGISERRVQILCREKRIQGVSKLGYMWLIPKDAENRLTVEPNKERSYTMNKVLIIDDDKELCALIKRSVLSEDIEADFCNTGKEGLQKLKEREYQLVILDIMMPGMDGFETLEEIRKENSLPILMFTSKNDSASKVRGLRAGADDYLTKPFDMDELIARIISLIRRYTRFNQQDGISQQLEFDGLKIDIENRSVTTENGTFELPPKEFDLLLYCAKNQGKILTKQQIYEEVWREEYFYDDSNIMAIISRLRKKLEVNPGSPKYIQTIKGIGYRFNKEV